MYENKMNELLTLTREKEALEAHIEAIKSELREALPEGFFWSCEAGSIGKSKAVADSVSVDLASWRKSSPAGYAEVLRKYPKTRKGHEGAITVKLASNK